VTVTVLQAMSGAKLTPANGTSITTAKTAISFVDLDQFGNLMASQYNYALWTSTVPAGATSPQFRHRGQRRRRAEFGTFSHGGNYTLTAWSTMPNGQTYYASTAINVVTVASSIVVSTPSPEMQTGTTQRFSAQEFDEFGNLISPQPNFTWTCSGGGTITSSGAYTAGSTAGNITVSAKYGSLTTVVSFSVGPNFLGLQDTKLAALVKSLDADGSISRQDAMQLLQSTVAGGTLSAVDLTDLKTIDFDAAQLNMPDYVRVLTGDIVNGSAANALYQGQTLGNLKAGSTATQMNELIGKWFLGADHPTLCNTSLVYKTVFRLVVPAHAVAS